LSFWSSLSATAALPPCSPGARRSRPRRRRLRRKADTIDILFAKSDIALGQPLNPAELEWQAWPATTTATNFIRKPDRPNAIETLSGYVARTPFVAGEPIREAKPVNPKGSGFMAAILPSGSRAISTQISPRPVPEASSCRTTAST
jgi:Flp pilus assembly protein CpaB